MRPSNTVLGVLVASIASARPLRLPEAPFLLALCSSGAALGMTVYVFSPNLWDPHERRLLGYRPGRGGSWLQEQVPLPDVVYDRSHYGSAEEQAAGAAMLAQMHRCKPFSRLSRPLPGKLHVQELLAGCEQLAPLLPDTLRCEGVQSLRAALRRFGGSLFIKPDAGMQGKGVLRITPAPEKGSWLAAGRTGSNRTFSTVIAGEDECVRRAARFAGRTAYLLQPALNLYDPEGRPFDVRALVQKNGKGRWSLTGCSVRKGLPGSVTSNLHGGGEPAEAAESLSMMFGGQLAESLLKRIRSASLLAAQTLESRCGRLAELGFDFGIEPDGRLWLLEANSKPGRACFLEHPGSPISIKAVRQPLLYARLLSSRGSSAAAAPPVPQPNRKTDGNSTRNHHTENVQEVHP
ncbi:YheC/YheD family protein [Paenibacillus beijingensis]|uniref:YheC/YheD family endospore coat-associated protein n=1 Tax=Paenibacillus beijingensis TaxID=1126833 RepID=UPI00069910CE|nr:YheC/YheD family protein [Paenibacillus beijingensis]